MYYLKEKPDDRHVFWACDTDGGHGKSYLAKRIQWEYQDQC